MTLPPAALKESQTTMGTPEAGDSVTADLTLGRLRSELREDHRLWVRAAIWTSLVGYALAAIVNAVAANTSPLLDHDSYVVLLALVAAGLERKGQVKSASLVLMATLLGETHLSVMESGLALRGDALFPAIAVGVSLSLGPRVGMRTALAMLVSIPLCVQFGLGLGIGPGWVDGDLVRLVAIEGATLGVTLLLVLLMRAFGRALEKSERHEARAREVVEGAPDAMIALDPQGVIVDCNAAARALFKGNQSAAAGLIGSSLRELGLVEVGVEDDSSVGRLDRLSLSPKEYGIKGQERRLDGLLRRLTRADGTQDALIVLRDITARRQAEQHALELQEQLQHSQKLEALGQLAGGIAHDFNNLLASVGGYGDLLQRHADPRVREMAKELSSVRDRGARLTRQLLAFARKGTTQPKAVDLGRIINGMDRLVKQLIGGRIKLELELNEGVVVWADRGQLEQVVLNLAMNARDAMPEGGTLHIATHHDVDTAELTVSDTGEGIDDAVKPRIFEPFYTTKPKGQGTGLGLSTVHGIVKASDGQIQVFSERGQGTRLVIRWPLCEELDHTSPGTQDAERSPAGDRRILLVEDDSDNRQVLGRLLTEAGYRVTAAPDAESAWSEYLKPDRPRPDLLITDVLMPGATGIELALQLRQRQPQLPVLFVSGYLGQALDDTEFDAMQDLLIKPFDAATLLARVTEKLAGAQQA